MEKIQVYLPSELHNIARFTAQRSGVSLSDLVRRAIQEAKGGFDAWAYADLPARRTTLRLTEEQAAWLRQQAKSAGMPTAEFIRALLRARVTSTLRTSTNQPAYADSSPLIWPYPRQLVTGSVSGDGG